MSGSGITVGTRVTTSLTLASFFILSSTLIAQQDSAPAAIQKIVIRSPDSTRIILQNIIARIDSASDIVDLHTLEIAVQSQHDKNQREVGVDWIREISDSGVRIFPRITVNPQFLSRQIKSEAMLAGVLSHEIAHIIFGHFEDSESRKDESWLARHLTLQAEADSFAIILMSQAGYRVSEYGAYLESAWKKTQDEYDAADTPVEMRLALYSGMEMKYRLQTFPKFRKSAIAGAKARFILMDKETFARLKHDFGQVR